MLELEVESVDQLREVARTVAYTAWGMLGEKGKPALRVAASAETTMLVRTAWERVP